MLNPIEALEQKVDAMEARLLHAIVVKILRLAMRACSTALIDMDPDRKEAYSQAVSNLD